MKPSLSRRVIELGKQLARAIDTETDARIAAKAKRPTRFARRLMAQRRGK